MDNSPLKDCTLLYVEDDIIIQELLAKRLKRIVKNLYVASNGEEGFAEFLEHKPDMIVTDVTMPKLNGIEMSKKIREHNKNIPIIILSAHGESKLLLDAIECGINNYLVKPLDKNKLFDMLESNAKKISMEKLIVEQQNEVKHQKDILQKIIDTNNNILVITDYKSITFVNKPFLDFFKISDKKEFEDTYNSILDVFCEFSDYIHKGLLSCNIHENHINSGKQFYKLIQKIDDTKRVVIVLDHNLEPKSFYINITLINEDKGLYLISLTDITKMTIEKVKIEQKAYIDALTGAANRNRFEETFRKEIIRTNRYHTPLSISILDIDYFKKFNDTHGHLEGDKVLILITQVCEKNLRNIDLFARWGGEEFVILFPQTKLEEARIAIEKIRTQIENIKYKNLGKITCSFGITQFKKNDTSKSIFKRCDEALYRAKENGRNRVETG